MTTPLPARTRIHLQNKYLRSVMFLPLSKKGCRCCKSILKIVHVLQEFPIRLYHILCPGADDAAANANEPEPIPIASDTDNASLYVLNPSPCTVPVIDAVANGMTRHRVF